MVELTRLPSPPVTAMPRPDGTLTALKDEQLHTIEPIDMEPGKNYIAKLPGRSRPAFVRKRRDAIESAFGLTAIARAFGPARPRPSASVERSEPEVRVCSAPSPQYFMTPPQQPPLQIGYTDPSRPTHVAPHALTMYPVQSQYVQTFTEPQPQISETISTKVIAKDSQQEDPAFYQHRCASCGKFRSPSYNIRHQLAAGETPKPSICRKCIKERTSSEGSDSHDESHSQKRNKREAHRNRRERGVERRKNTDSIEEIKRGSSSEEEIRTIRRVRSLSRRPTYLRRSWSRSSTRTRNSYKSNRYRSGRGRLSDEDVVLVKRVRYVERPNRRRSQSRPRNPPPYRRSLNYEDDEKLVEQRSPEYEHPQAHATVEVRRIRQDEFTLHNYDNEHAEDYATEPPLHRSVSMVAHPGTPTRAEQGDYFTRYFTRSTAPYPDHIPIRRQVSRLSYGYDQSHDEALLPPARSVRIVRAQPDSDNPVQIRRWDRDGVGNASSQVSLVEPSYRVQSPEVITVEPDDPLGRQWRGRHQDASGFVEQESINERYPSGPSSPRWRHTEGRMLPSLPGPRSPLQESYLNSVPPDGHREILHTLQRTHIASPGSHFPIRDRGALGHDRRVRSRSASCYGWNETRKHYVDTSGNRAIYKDV